MHTRETYDEARLNVPVAVRYLGHEVQGLSLRMVFVLMETSLSKFVASSEYNHAAISQFGSDMVIAVEFLHNKANVVHCDIKSDNVMIKDGRAYIADFGLATIAVREQRRKKRAEVWGTPKFMAPEILFFENDNNFESDIWALGVTLFEMITQRMAFAEYDDLRDEEFAEKIASLEAPICFTEEETKRQPLLVKFSLMACQQKPDKRPTAGQLAEEITANTEIKTIAPEWDTGCTIV